MGSTCRAVTIATSILEYLPGFGTALLEIVRGGSDVGSATLRIFHTLHSGFLPLLLLFFMTWYFIGLQELLIHVNPVVVVLILPLLTAFFLLFFPFVKEDNIQGNRLVRLLFIGLVVGFALLTVVGLCFRGPAMQLVCPF